MTRECAVCNGRGTLWNTPRRQPFPGSSLDVMCWQCVGKGYLQDVDNEIELGDNSTDIQ